MKKEKVRIKDYGPAWMPENISVDLNVLCRDGWSILSAFPITKDLEVARYPDPLPGLNDGDSVSVKTDMRVILTK